MIKFHFLLLLAFSASLLLNSCGSENGHFLFTASTPYKIEARHDMEDKEGEILVDGVGALDDHGGLLEVRSVQKKIKMIEHYNDQLLIDWSIPLPITSYEAWSPSIVHKNGNWNCLGLDKYEG